MIATSTGRLRRSNWRLYAPAGALILWGCLWLNLNTNPWNIQAPDSPDEWQLLIRSILPFAVLPVAVVLVLDRRKLGLPTFSPSRLLMIYGVLAALAAVVSPQSTWSLYWSTAFLATIAAAWTFASDADSGGVDAAVLAGDLGGDVRGCGNHRLHGARRRIWQRSFGLLRQY